MVKLDVITTRAGDGGETSLGDGTRVSKDSLRIVAMGAVDEANAALGLLRLQLTAEPTSDTQVARLRNDLFDLGADLCVPGTAGARLRVTGAHCLRLERESVELNANLPALTSFV